MAIKQALIVDDSKSARVVLKRMLEGLDLVVNTTESATDALDYLQKFQPDVIFMDHMMPGMDGFEAIKHIKNNSETAVIPIMMYTSRGGDVYLSQARALGAVGIIPKTISPVGLKESLFKLGLIEDRRKPAEENEILIENKPVIAEATSNKSKQQLLEKDLLENQTKHDGYLEDMQRVMDDQTIELHKSMWLGIESVSHEIFNRLSNEIDGRFEKLQTLPADVADEVTKSKANGITCITFVGGTILILSLILNIFLLSDKPFASDAAIADSDNALESIEVPADSDELQVVDYNAVLDFVNWAKNKKLDYPYDELALNDTRLLAVEILVKKALEAGYTGSIVLQTHVGRFCLDRNENGAFALAEDDVAVTQCEYIGNYLQPTDAPATHQSLSFANYLSDLGELSGKGIYLEVNNESRVIEIEKYPELHAETTVKEWNRVAHLNNSVTVKLLPSSYNSTFENE